MPQLVQQANRLVPAEALLHQLALALADLVARVPGRAAVDRTAALRRDVLRYVRREARARQPATKSIVS